MPETEVIQVNKMEAVAVLTQVDNLLAQADEAVNKAGDCFIDVSFLLVKVKRGAYWTERGYHTETEYIDQVFPQSRAQYYTFIRFGTNLQGYKRESLKRWGRSKCEDLVRLHIHFEGSVPREWFDHLEHDNKETFRRRVREFLDEKDRKQVEGDTEKETPETEDCHITIKIFGNGIHTFNLAMDTMAKIMGSDKSIGHRVELICANFNAQFADDGTGHVMGSNAYIRNTIEGLVKQYNLKEKDASELLIGIVAKAIEQNVAS